MGNTDQEVAHVVFRHQARSPVLILAPLLLFFGASLAPRRTAVSAEDPLGPKESAAPANVGATSACDLELVQGTVVILASVDMLRDDFLKQAGGDYRGNLQLIENCLDALTLRSDMVEIPRGPSPVADRGRGEGIPADFVVCNTTRSVLQGLRDKVRVTYYLSEALPEPMQDLRHDTELILDAFRKAGETGWDFDYAIVSPDEEAFRWAEERTLEYLAARKRGQTPREPAPSEMAQDTSCGSTPRSDDEIRSEREGAAKRMAQTTGRPREECERELLIADWSRRYFKELEERGIRAFPLTMRQGLSVRQQKTYSSIEIKYLDLEPELMPFHCSCESLEYDLVVRILRLTRRQKPVIAFFDGRRPGTARADPQKPDPPPASDYAGLVEHLGSSFEVRPIALEEGASIDDLIAELKRDARRRGDLQSEPLASEATGTVKPQQVSPLPCLVVAQPDRLAPRQVYELSRAVSLGMPTIFLLSPYSMNASSEGARQGLPLTRIHPGLEDVFMSWGIRWGKKLLASNESGSINLPRLFQSMRVLMQTPLPVIVAASGKECIDQESPLTTRIQTLAFPATTGLQLLPDALERNDIEAKVLARTARQTWAVEITDPPEGLNPFTRTPSTASVAMHATDLMRPKDPDEFQDWEPPTPLAVFLTGKFPFMFQGKTIPEWKQNESAGEGDG